MEVIGYLENISERLSRYFDINQNFLYRDMEYQLQAKSFIRNEKYLGSKKLTLYAYENNEHCLVKHYQNMDSGGLRCFLDNLKAYTIENVKPHDEHMLSIVNGVILMEEFDNAEIQREIENYKFYKSFSFGLQGWVYQRVLLVNLGSGEVITNRRGREVAKFYKIKK